MFDNPYIGSCIVRPAMMNFLDHAQFRLCIIVEHTWPGSDVGQIIRSIHAGEKATR